MTKTEVKVKFTYQDYLHMPEDKRYELIEGQFFMVPSPNEYHQRISREVLSFTEDGYKQIGVYTVDTPLSSPLLKGLTLDLQPVFS